MMTMMATILAAPGSKRASKPHARGATPRYTALHARVDRAPNVTTTPHSPPLCPLLPAALRPRAAGTPTSGFEWDRVDYGAEAPAGRWKSAGDVIGDTLIVYGGDDGQQFMSDVWALPLLPLNPNSSLATSTSAVDGSKLPGWIEPAVSSGSDSGLPSGRRGHVTVAAHKGNVIVMQGGRKKHHVCLQDTWLLSPKDGATGPDAWSGPLEW